MTKHINALAHATITKIYRHVYMHAIVCIALNLKTEYQDDFKYFTYIPELCFPW